MINIIDKKFLKQAAKRTFAQERALMAVMYAMGYGLGSKSLIAGIVAFVAFTATMYVYEYVLSASLAHKNLTNN